MDKRIKKIFSNCTSTHVLLPCFLLLLPHNLPIVTLSFIHRHTKRQSCKMGYCIYEYTLRYDPLSCSVGCMISQLGHHAAISVKWYVSGICHKDVAFLTEPVESMDWSVHHPTNQPSIFPSIIFVSADRYQPPETKTSTYRLWICCCFC